MKGIRRTGLLGLRGGFGQIEKEAANLRLISLGGGQSKIPARTIADVAGQRSAMEII
jgi:hypothetical protein